MPRQLRLAPLAAALAAFVGAAFAQQANLGVAPVTVSDTPYTFDSAEVHKIKVSVVARGLAHPFSLAFLPNGDALISERGAKLRIVRGAAAGGRATLDPEPVAGTPEPPGIRNFGLHDVALHPQFAANKLVYFTFNKAGAEIPNSNPPGRRQASTVIMRGTWDGKAIADAKEIFGGQWSAGASGSRLAFGNDGMLYMTTGAPFDEAAQDPASIYGKVLRLRDDGSVPADNPFAKQPGARPEVFSLGHRDQLGLTVHRATGSVLAAEHGPNGGDEVNLILPGRNYGWPKWTYGRAYDGARMSAMPVTEGIEQPLVLWVPSIAPTGLTFYTGEKLPEWRGNLFVGSARIGEIPRTGGLERVVFNDKLEELRRERLLSGLHQRIRDVREGPDGLLYVITDEDDGVLLRIEPATS
jgi:glucose/arabinose dehydrogenase